MFICTAYSEWDLILVYMKMSYSEYDFNRVSIGMLPNI